MSINDESIELEGSLFSSTVEEEQLDEDFGLSDVSNTQDILDQIVLPHDEHAHYELDLRQEQIFRTVRDKVKAGPKPPMLEAEEQKIGVERQLEDNSKQLNTLIEFGDLILSNIKALREKSDKFRREIISERRRELSKKIRRESIEAEAQYSMIKAKWLELDSMDEPLELYRQVEAEKRNVDQLMQSKDKLLEDCQEEIDRLNSLFDEDLQQQNQDLNCFGQMVLHQCDLFSKATQGQIELLEAAVDDEWQYMCLVSRQRWHELNELVNANVQNIYEIINAKERLYEKEIKKLTFEQEEMTRTTTARLEREAADLDCELRNAKANALLNSEMLDYNYNVLQHRHAEDITLSNQQKRRVAKIIQKIAYLKYKMSTYLKQSEVKVDRLNLNIKKLHASITDLEVKYVTFNTNNKKKFDKIWELEFKEIKNVMNQIMEIDKIMYRTQLAKCWDPIKIEMVDIRRVSTQSKDSAEDKVSEKSFDKSSEKASDKDEVSSESVILDAEERAKEVERQMKKERHSEVRFLRNVLRKIAFRSKVFFESRLYNELEKLAENEKFLLTVENVFRVLKITDMKKVNELVKYFKPYAWCPNCQEPPREKIIEKLYRIYMPPLEPKDEESRCGKEPVIAQECQKHEQLIEPLLLLTALREFAEAQGNDLEVDALQNARNESYEMSVTVNKIKAYFKQINEALSKQRLDTWRAMKHGLTHFQVLLEERMTLHDECLNLSRQNAELKYFIGENVEVPEPAPEEPDLNIC